MLNLRFVTFELSNPRKKELPVIEYLLKKELVMIKYLLKNAKYLEKITILHAPPLGLDVIREISGYEKASAEVEVKIHQI